MCYIQRYLTLKPRHAKVDLTQQEQALSLFKGGGEQEKGGAGEGGAGEGAVAVAVGAEEGAVAAASSVVAVVAVAEDSYYIIQNKYQKNTIWEYCKVYMKKYQ